MKVSRYIPFNNEVAMVPDPHGTHVDILDYAQLVRRCDEAARLLGKVPHGVQSEEWVRDLTRWQQEEIGRP